MNEVHYSSKSNEWATPQSFFAELNEEFHFTLDPCATEDNAKCPMYYTLNDNGLAQNWGGKLCSAILHTAENSASGCIRHTWKAGKQTRL